jgi:hypothetical protein
MNKLLRFVSLLLAVALFGTGCTSNNQGDSASPVYLTVDFTLRPAVKNVNDGAPIQIQTTTVTSKLKIPSTTSPGAFLDTQLDTYAVVWTRIDGGKSASKTENFAPGVIVPAGGTASLQNYVFMSASSLQEPPLSFLFPYNGGIDPETHTTEIRQTGTVTLYGHTMSGQPVTSVPAAFDMIFVYRAAAGRIEAVPAR